MPRGGAREGAGRKKKPGGKIKPTARTTLITAVRAAKGLTLRLLDELDAITTHHGELEDLIEIETASDEDYGRRRDAMLKAIGLPSRAAVLKQLLAATRAWSELERPAAKPVLSKGDGHKPPAQGKKAERAAAAKEASVGKFAPPSPPRGPLN